MQIADNVTAFVMSPELIFTDKIPTKFFPAEPRSSKAVEYVCQNTQKDGYALIYTSTTPIELHQNAVARLLSVAKDSDAGLVYCDYVKMTNGKPVKIPTLPYHIGCVRDDFDFGPLMLVSYNALASYAAKAWKYAALYDLRLSISRTSTIFHLPECLYTVSETDLRKSGEKQFDYVSPTNREVQIEMELAFTDHLKAIGAYLAPSFKNPNLQSETFEYEASVIIPVRNRAKTIADAVNSVLSQKTGFKFSVLVADNLSTDGTSEIVMEIARQHDNVYHIVPEKEGLGIGGCWNLAVDSQHCGKFAVQLDSDDLYQDEHTLQKIVDGFYEQNCAMLVGSYTLVDFDLNIIPPGLISHAEWTEDNGRNNALRINGLGAPRAFYTPILRQLHLPNTSYGEDYAIGLRISREYKIGRIYESLYLCRRWTGNSDAALDIAAVNANNVYKDSLRALEIMARQQFNKQN